MSEELKQLTGAEILALPMRDNDSGADTVRGYLIALLTELWWEEESFSGERPFGNSGWQYDLYLPLVVAGAVAGKLDEFGYIDSVDEDAASALIESAIRALGAP